MINRLFIFLMLIVSVYQAHGAGCFENMVSIRRNDANKLGRIESISFSKIKAAAERIYNSGLVKQTPLLKSDALSLRFGTNVYLKLDYQQNIGAFKIRGAANSMLVLVQSKGTIKGVVTASSGNHAQGIALTARES